MTEQQLRDVLARVVPEAPDTVADAGPVVRAARRRRQVRVAGASALAAVVIAGTVLAVGALRQPDENLVADPPTARIPDPYTTAQCPALSERWITMPADDLSRVVAIRYCTRGTDNGFPVAEGPEDALVTDLGSFTRAVRGLGSADPARCAAVDPVPTDSRLLLELADGTSIGVPAGLCQDAEIEGRTVDGADLAAAFLASLRFQRDDHDYAPDDLAPVTQPDCLSGGISPALPASEHLVAAVACTGSGTLTAVDLAGAEVERLDAAWREATLDQPSCDGAPPTVNSIVARTGHGDLVTLAALGCDQYGYFFDEQAQFLVTFPYVENTGGGG